MKVVVSSEELVDPPRVVEDIHTVVVKDNFDNPIYVAIQQTDDSIWVITPEDSRFEAIVQQLGISKRLSVKVGSL